MKMPVGGKIQVFMFVSLTLVLLGIICTKERVTCLHPVSSIVLWSRNLIAKFFAHCFDREQFPTNFGFLRFFHFKRVE